MTPIDPDVFAPTEEEIEAHEPNGFKIDGLNSADWAIRKVSKARQQVEDLKQLAEAEAGRIADWLAEAAKPHLHTMVFFEDLLQDWHASQIEADFNDEKAWKHEGNKTIKLPGGELRIKRSPATVEIDSEVFLAGIGRPDLVSEKTTYKPIHAAVKKAVLEDGEALPGVEVVPASVTWNAVTE